MYIKRALIEKKGSYIHYLLQFIKHGAKHVGNRGFTVAGMGHSVRFYYGKPADHGLGASTPVRTVDLRSDTITKPGAAMRKAMAEAEVGDDVFGEDPSVNELQKQAAEMFGMEAALFVPSGTMSNLIAVMVHCKERGDEMIVGDRSHMHVYEQGGSAQLAGVPSSMVANLPDGTFDLAEVEAKIRHGYPDAHYPRSRLVCVENTQNIQGGRVLPLSFLRELRSLADRYDLKVHMDGARLMNAVVALGVAPSVILRHCHTVSVCLSKGLGAPVGTILAGPGDFVQRAVRARKALGGGMRQAGILAAAGRLALTDMVGRLQEDHQRARSFAEALMQCDPPLYQVDMTAVETNILRFYLRAPSLSPAEFCEHAASVCDDEVRALGQGVRLLMFPHVGGSIRAVWHLGVTDDDTRAAVAKMGFLARRYARAADRIQ
uniref:Threonine aldolase 1 n=1 Tax=Paramormyrops kingsleyae TaxID=1676925 RepID=A0A3B3SBF2_9TELE